MTNKMVERITRSFESQSMMKTLGAMIHKVEKGNVIIEAPLLPSTLQQQGYVHAGLTFSIGDSAAGYSALTLLPEDQEVMTAEIKINLLAPCRRRTVASRRQSRETRETVGSRYFGDPCPKRWAIKANCHHAGNDDSCYGESLKCKK